eukprot:gene15039-biopygen20159
MCFSSFWWGPSGDLIPFCPGAQGLTTQGGGGGVVAALEEWWCGRGGEVFSRNTRASCRKDGEGSFGRKFWLKHGHPLRCRQAGCPRTGSRWARATAVAVETRHSATVPTEGRGQAAWRRAPRVAATHPSSCPVPGGVASSTAGQVGSYLAPNVAGRARLPVVSTDGAAGWECATPATSPTRKLTHTIFVHTRVFHRGASWAPFAASADMSITVARSSKRFELNSSSCQTDALTDDRMGIENTIFCAHPCVPSMVSFGSERGYTRRCGASFKPLLAGLDTKMLQKVSKNETPCRPSQWPARDAQKHHIPVNLSSCQTDALTDARVGIENTIFVHTPVYHRWHPLGASAGIPVAAARLSSHF